MTKKQRRLPKYKLVEDLIENVRDTIYSYPNNSHEAEKEEKSREKLIRAIERDKKRIRELQDRIVELSKMMKSRLDPPARNDKIIPILPQ